MNRGNGKHDFRLASSLSLLLIVGVMLNWTQGPEYICIVQYNLQQETGEQRTERLAAVRQAKAERLQQETKEHQLWWWLGEQCKVQVDSTYQSVCKILRSQCGEAVEGASCVWAARHSANPGNFGIILWERRHTSAENTDSVDSVLGSNCAQGARVVSQCSSHGFWT